MTPDLPMPSPKARFAAVLWLIASLLPTVGLMVYLSLSSSAQPNLAQISEEPHLFTALLAGGSLLSLAVVTGRSRLFFPSSVLTKMRIGSAAGLVGFFLYSFYVYSFSALPPAPLAPKVGDQAPDFAVTDPDGRTWTLSELKGDVLVFFYRGHW